MFPEVLCNRALPVRRARHQVYIKFTIIFRRLWEIFLCFAQKLGALSSNRNDIQIGLSKLYDFDSVYF